MLGDCKPKKFPSRFGGVQTPPIPPLIRVTDISSRRARNSGNSWISGGLPSGRRRKRRGGGRGGGGQHASCLNTSE